MTTYSDEYLNFHADRYSAGRLHAHGITLDAYLADPARYDALALEPEPLLPTQQAVAQRIAAVGATHASPQPTVRATHASPQPTVGATHASPQPAPGVDALTARLEADIGDARLADSGLVEPLHHHRMPQHPGARRRFHRLGAR